MRILSVACVVGLWAAVPAFCHLVIPMPEPAMAGELVVTGVGFAGLIFLFRKKKNS